MSVIKVIEVLSESSKSWEDAAQIALQEAAKTLENIRSIYIQEFSVHVDHQKITRYRIDAKISFEVMQKD